ncbi:MAG: biotin--[Erysipelotrichaceae bacterium]|nr:biotin--[acetyl-CoA-carboxylase] ligase [Erysipelotrichaceae bacterium]
MRKLFFESLNSTNTYLKEHYPELEDLTFVFAEYQSEGKGRNGRKWLSDKGESLMFSILIKDQTLIQKYQSLSVICAYTILKVLKDYGIEDVMIKWPNDVYVKDCKICGILLEAVSREMIEALICGIGLNVNQKEFAGEYNTEPVSMRMLLNREIEIRELQERVSESFIENIEKLKRGYDFHEEISGYDYLKDKEVFALIGNERKRVKVTGIDEDYSLKVNCDGEDLNISSGEITFHL